MEYIRHDVKEKIKNEIETTFGDNDSVIQDNIKNILFASNDEDFTEILAILIYNLNNFVKNVEKDLKKSKELDDSFKIYWALYKKDLVNNQKF